MELVRQLDDPVAALVGVADGVRAGLRQRELEVRDHLVGEHSLVDADEAAQGEAPEADVLRFGGNRQMDHPNLLALWSAHRQPTFPVTRSRQTSEILPDSRETAFAAPGGIPAALVRPLVELHRHRKPPRSPNDRQRPPPPPHHPPPPHPASLPPPP